MQTSMHYGQRLIDNIIYIFIFIFKNSLLKTLQLLLYIHMLCLVHLVVLMDGVGFENCEITMYDICRSIKIQITKFNNLLQNIIKHSSAMSFII